MRIRTIGQLAVAVALVCLFSGCAPTEECGSWAFSGTPQSHPDQFPLSSAFTFNPSTCGKTCVCDIDAMIQMTWVYDATDQTNIYATSADEARATSNGWNIDRVTGSGYGWYGLLNDGKTFYSGWNTPGSNGKPNTLYDEPGGWPNNTWFYAVDVAVCFKSDTCVNRILGYYFWSWVIDGSGNATEFITSPAWKDLDTEFQNALAGWNAWAPTSGPQDDGTKLLPNAVSFPSMSDL